jgi:hypothetical protein
MCMGTSHCLKIWDLFLIFRESVIFHVKARFSFSYIVLVNKNSVVYNRISDKYFPLNNAHI